MPAREAFASARIIVVPSRAESMPYVVLEAIAAGMPIVATRVGGIPEIFGPAADELVVPGDPGALAQAIEDMLRASAPDCRRRRRETRLAAAAVSHRGDAGGDRGAVSQGAGGEVGGAGVKLPLPARMWQSTGAAVDHAGQTNHLMI